jgi:hypothetical protein
LEDYVYYINSGDSATIVPTYTNLDVDGTTACTPYFYLHFWNQSKKLWVAYSSSAFPFVKSWNTATGGLVLNTVDFATFDNNSYETRITTL